VLITLVACAAFGVSGARAATTAASVCSDAPAGYVACDSKLIVDSTTRQPVHPVVHPVAPPHLTRTASTTDFQQAAEPAAAAPPEVATAAYLQQAYDLSYLSQTRGGGDTVAIVDAFDDPNAASDLATFRSQMGLSACTDANGCFRQVNENGAPSPLPASDSSWNVEVSLDLDAVSSLCPNCKILLVEASSASYSDMDQAVVTAAAMGADQISASWSGVSSTAAPGTYTFQGVDTVASTGDSGYLGAGVYGWPAAFPGVTAAAGTTLNASTTSASTARGFTETAWSLSNGSGGGAGCALDEPKPAYQTDSGCTGRTYADISADANPSTGLDVYDSLDGGWIQVGGTSLSAPLIAAFYAVTGVSNATPQWAYTDRSLLNDPVSGSIGTCATSISYICNAGVGFDGPTGNGSISGAVRTGAPGIGGPSMGSGTGNSYASSVSGTGATLAGGVYPNGLATTYHWEFGTTTAYGSQTTAVSVGSGTNAVVATGTLSDLSMGTTYHYRLVAQNGAGTTYGYDYTFTTPTVPVPLNTVAPTVTGTAAVGQKLTVAVGTWNPAASKYAYQWKRSSDGGNSWTNISSATYSYYTLTSADLGDLVRIQVTATNSYGTANAYSASTVTVASGAPVSTVQPTITGTAAAGQKLTTAVGTWNPAARSYAYQWQHSADGGNTWTNITSATYSYYTLPTSYVGDIVRVRVTATNTYGTTLAYSPSTVTVASGAPVSTIGPTITGTAAAGQKLTTAAGTWSPAGTSYAYQWQYSADGGSTWTDIPSATYSYYTLPTSYVGDIVRVRVTATNTYGTTLAYSPSTVTVASGAPVSTVAPKISGTMVVGQRLSASYGTWSPAGTSYTYQWQRSATGSSSGTWTSITSATSSTYTLTTADNGNYVRVVVTAKNTYGSATANSAASSLVT
jgi:hypothetical protein